MKCVRIVDGVVVEVIPPHSEQPDFAKCFHPDFLKKCLGVMDWEDVQVNDIWDGQVFTRPPRSTD